MPHLLLVFYVVFFATGFMGGTALLLLDLRVRSRLLRPLLLFQGLYLFGLGIALIYFYRLDQPGEIPQDFTLIILLFINTINISIYATALLLIRRISPPESRRTVFPAAAEILILLVIAKVLTNLFLTATGTFPVISNSEFWNLIDPILVGLAIAAFGLILRSPLQPGEPAFLKPLLKAYSLCALIFAPLGIIEYGVSYSGLFGIKDFSVDYLFYFFWNLASMSVAIRLFRLDSSSGPSLNSVPSERIQALGLSPRETEMAIMIARGLSNKEIAVELFISPATVRTHIYNLYRKVDAGNRVELINKLRG